MERKIRASLEEYLDTITEDHQFDIVIQVWKGFEEEGVISSVESAILGMIYGGLNMYLSSFLAKMKTPYQNIPNYQEITSQIFKRRVAEIQHKLRLNLNR